MNFVSSKKEDKQPPKTMAQLYEEADHAVEQFMFLIFIPNPSTKRVKVIVDDGFTTLTMKIDDFINKIFRLCGSKEADRIRVYCHDYGDIYMYDREKQTIKQLYERADRKIELSDYLADLRKHEDDVTKKTKYSDIFETHESTVYEKISDRVTEENNG